MDQKQIEEIVRSVMASMGQAAPAPSEAKCATTNCAAPVTSESCALDLGSAEAKAWIGVENPHRADVLTELRRSTRPAFVPVVPVRVHVPRRCCVSWPITLVRKIPY